MGRVVHAMGSSARSISDAASSALADLRLWMNPVLVGGGKRRFPPLPEVVALRLAESRTFPSGQLDLRYERV